VTILVGYPPEARGRGALELGAQLARTDGAPLVVCCVVPTQWETPSLARVDAEYAAHVRRVAERALEHAREELDHDAELVVRTGRSVARALLAEARRRDARMVVCGSSSHGPWGHVALGTLSDRLLHSSPLPVGIAPRGYRAGGGTVRRVTVALDGTPMSVDVLRSAARVTAQTGADLRAVAFAVRGRTMYPPEAGLHAEDLIVAAWREEASAQLAHAVAALEQDGLTPPSEVGIVDADDWEQALENAAWQPGDLLVLGWGRAGPVSKVFLGSTATRILRHTPVPAVVLPRVAAQRGAVGG
jgi:nucleotide-binding universal stress UspA family protein